jgi:hypothetical protein
MQNKRKFVEFNPKEIPLLESLLGYRHTKVHLEKGQLSALDFYLVAKQCE